MDIDSQIEKNESDCNEGRALAMWSKQHVQSHAEEQEELNSFLETAQELKVKGLQNNKQDENKQHDNVEAKLTKFEEFKSDNNVEETQQENI